MTWNTVYCRKATKSSQESKHQLTAPSKKWAWAWKHSGMVDRAFKREIHFTQTPLDFKSYDLDYSLLQEHYKKSGHKLKDQLTAPSIKWSLTWKHLGMVDRTSRREIHFTQTPLDFKSNDLEYSLLTKKQL
jgi:hypothetical protein